MSTMIAPLPLTVSKPKIHRLPVANPPEKQKKLPFPGFLLFWAAVLVALVAVSLAMKREPVIVAATTLPAVAIVSERIPPVISQDPVVSQDNAVVIEAPGPAGSNILSSIGDAQAATGSAGIIAAKPGATIMLKDNSGEIVGQMAKIPLENEQITEVKAINDIDNKAGRELLSILNKY